MPDEDKKEPRNESRIVIEPMPEPEKPLMDRVGRINPWDKRYMQERQGRRRITRRA